MQTQKSIEDFEKICDLLDDRLNITGEIKTKDAWDICYAARCGLEYQTIAYHFKKIMELMVELKKAEPLKSGQWRILKPNKIKR